VTIGAVILAAGQSRRMGRNKMLLPYGTSTVLETIVTEVTACPAVTDVVIVTGHEPNRITALLAPYSVRCVFNPAYARAEMLVSLQVGVRALSAEVQAVLIVLGDHPRLRRDIIQQVIDAYQPGALVIPSYQLKRGHPLLIDRLWWAELLALPETATLRDFIRAHEDHIRYVVAEADSVLQDMDTPEEYRGLTTAEAQSARRNAASGQISEEGEQETHHDDQ
jgi:molybdenum cofactor cytidylyltransferase